MNQDKRRLAFMSIQRYSVLISIKCRSGSNTLAGIEVQKQKHHINDALIVMDTKNGDAVKSVPMHPALQRYIERHLTYWPPRPNNLTGTSWKRCCAPRARLATCAVNKP